MTSTVCNNMMQHMMQHSRARVVATQYNTSTCSTAQHIQFTTAAVQGGHGEVGRPCGQPAEAAAAAACAARHAGKRGPCVLKCAVCAGTPFRSIRHRQLPCDARCSVGVAWCRAMVICNHIPIVGVIHRWHREVVEAAVTIDALEGGSELHPLDQFACLCRSCAGRSQRRRR